MEAQLKQIMADVLDLDAESIDESTTQDNTPTWDSVNQINLIIALEQEFEVTFCPEEFEVMTSFRDVLETLEKKLRIRTQ
jgi:acyl carrier protein